MCRGPEGTEKRVLLRHRHDASPCMGRAVGFVIKGRMMLGAVVCPVEIAWGPVEPELALGVAATVPIETHVHGLGLLGGDGLIGDSNGGGIVGLKRGLGLGPTHFDEGLAQGGAYFWRQ